MLALGAAALLLTACDARATGPNPSAVASITLTLPSPIMAAGRTDRIAATLLDHAGHKISGLTPEWSSSDQSVVAIDGTGEVRTVAAGSSTITATVGTAKASIVIDVAPASIPFLNRPFQGTYALVNPVDHDVPEEFVDDNGVQIDWTGETSHFLDGHSGYDWELPEGTPVLAAQDGRINIAGRETPFSCPLLNGDTVAALLVNVLHQAPTGELFASLYYHLSRVDVTVGDSVQAGEQLGLSGNTGCSTGPHLHFEVIRELYTRDGFRNGVVTDPYGWIGTQDDPWLLDAHGAVSSNLWLPDQAPQGVLTVDAAQRARGSSNVAKPRILDVDRFTPSLHLAPMRRGKKNPP
jgi:murein DD-endopeptidase MepM/ murein hydrolase activator NlpD